MLAKLDELGLECRIGRSNGARENLEKRLERLGHENTQTQRQWMGWIIEGINAFIAYVGQAKPLDDYHEIRRLRRLASNFYFGEDEDPTSIANLTGRLTGLKSQIQAAEKIAQRAAVEMVEKLTEKHTRCTKNWAMATNEMQLVLKDEIQRIEAERAEWKTKAVPLSQRFKELAEAERLRDEEREELERSWPELDEREKGESLRRMFKQVTLHWEKQFHPASLNPTRPRKTDRPGRYSYHLLRDQIEWSYATTDLGGCW